MMISTAGATTTVGAIAIAAGKDKRFCKLPSQALSIVAVLALSAPLACNQAWAAESRDDVIKRIKERVVDHKANASGSGPLTPPELKKMATDLDTILGANAADVDALYLRGSVRIDLRDMKGALTDLNTVIAKDPKYGKAYWQRGVIYVMSNHPKEAASDFKNAIANGEKSEALYMNLGSVEQAIGDDNAAVADLTKAIAMADDKAPKWLSCLMRANSYNRLKKYDLSLKDADAALASGKLPQGIGGEAHRTKGAALLATKHFKEAIDEFTKAADGISGPNKATSIYLRGACYHFLGQEEKSKADVEKAKSLGFRPSGSPPPDKPFQANQAELDAKIKHLIEQARKTLPDVKKRFLAGLPPKHTLSITTRIIDMEHKRMEQVFVVVKEWKGNTIHGILATDVQTPGHKKLEPMTVDEKDVLDWTIVNPDGSEEGNVVGKFLDTLQH